MKKIRFILAMMALGLGFSAGARADTSVYVAGAIGNPDAVISLSYFHDSLAPYGRWVQVAPYGSCWEPYNVSDDWRPYWDGYWSYTDYGWTWVSDEPFGWATYHYGRWAFDPDYGWVWIPDTAWGPAWVTWHDNDDWCGWAPLPPSAGWSASFGLQWSRYSIPDRSWCFVPRDHFYDRDLRGAYAPITRNRDLYGETRDATRFSVRNGKPVDRAFAVGDVERWTGKPVRHDTVLNLNRGRGADTANFDRGENVGRTTRPEPSQMRGQRSRQDAQRQLDQQRRFDQQRQFDQRRRFDQQRQLDQQRQFDQQRQLDQQRRFDQQRQIDQERQQATVDPRRRPSHRMTPSRYQQRQQAPQVEQRSPGTPQQPSEKAQKQRKGKPARPNHNDHGN